MINVATIEFTDIDSGDTAQVIIRGQHNLVSLAVSLMQDGDIEVFFTAQECEEIIKALQEALDKTISEEPNEA